MLSMMNLVDLKESLQNTKIAGLLANSWQYSSIISPDFVKIKPFRYCIKWSDAFIDNLYNACLQGDIYIPSLSPSFCYG